MLYIQHAVILDYENIAVRHNCFDNIEWNVTDVQTYVHSAKQEADAVYVVLCAEAEGEHCGGSRQADEQSV